MRDKSAIINDPQFVHHMYDEWLYLGLNGFLHPGETFARFIMAMANSRGQTTRRSRHRRIPVLMGGRFLPSNIAGLQLWLDANDVSTLFQDAAKTIPAGDGDVVGAWADKSGQGNDATQTVTADKPALQTGIVNGLPVIRGDGTDDDLDISVTFTNESIFVVCKNSVPAQVGTIIAQSGNFRLTYPTTNQIQYVHNGTINTIVGGFTSSVFNIFRAILDGANSSLAVNNSSPSVSAVGSVAHTYTRLFSRSSQVLNGDIAEIIIYDREVNASEIVQVETYLATKYGIALS